ncbi:siroheme synthase CysG [uncultured Rhodospira sp.]|uniref:siroheme synthase CysG n=1 Tax=uncultured Rhodospira sp. TaxID=1936189 RepID=UPI00262590AA|nr:siroheme synthase CysG [uncultured Rhodospira sp.]
MRHFPIFLDLTQSRVVVAGGGEAALAKLRLLFKTQAAITVFAADPAADIARWAAAGRLRLEHRAIRAEDIAGAVLAYAATGEVDEDARVAGLARAQGVLVNVVDDLVASQFITPAIVDRTPITIAIGTEGAAPVLARTLKGELEKRLESGVSALAEAGRAFRDRARALPGVRARCAFWAAWYGTDGPAALARGTPLDAALEALLARHLAHQPEPGRVDFVGAGPGDPDLLTLKARKALDGADVVLHDRLVAPGILDLARREATMIEAGKEGFGPSTPQDAINRLMIEHARAGARVVRLKAGDPAVFGRLDEEIEAVRDAGLDHAVIPGITAASAAAASIGRSLTRRGRNSGYQVLTGHDVKGFAEHDWRALARSGSVAAIYMGKRATRFLTGRLMMHGADPETPVTVVANASRPDARTLATSLARLPDVLETAGLTGPAVILYGLAPAAAEAALPAFPMLDTPEEIAL